MKRSRLGCRALGGCGKLLTFWFFLGTVAAAMIYLIERMWDSVRLSNGSEWMMGCEER